MEIEQIISIDTDHGKVSVKLPEDYFVVKDGNILLGDLCIGYSYINETNKVVPGSEHICPVDPQFIGNPVISRKCIIRSKYSVKIEAIYSFISHLLTSDAKERYRSAMILLFEVENMGYEFSETERELLRNLSLGEQGDEASKEILRVLQKKV